MSDFKPEYHFVKTQCGTCHRPMLIEYWVNGSNHTLGITVICAECLLKLPLPSTFEKEHPKEAEEIRNWAMEAMKEVGH